MTKLINLLFALIFLLNINCREKESKQQIQEQHNVVPQNTTSHIFKDKPISSKEKSGNYRVIFKPYEQIQSGEGMKDFPLTITQLIFANATVFIYKYQYSKSDTLEIYNDSLRFNNKLIKKISTRSFIANNKSYVVHKYYYSSVIENNFMSSNLYIDSSLGMILQEVVSQKSGIVEYKIGLELELLQQQIKKDSSYFNFKRLKD